MSAKQQNTWAFQDPDSSPCSVCFVPQTADALAEFSEFNILLKLSCYVF